MGTRKKFSVAEQELLRTNPYTEKVTENQISFTLAFKEAFWRLSVEGCTGNMALRKLGYDPELLGFERVHNITKRIRRAGEITGGHPACAKIPDADQQGAVWRGRAGKNVPPGE
ncbi:MAG: HTH domain-containing protein [Oscillospiraceae bacterium]